MSVHRPADRGWLLAAWGIPLGVAAVITVVTAGFGVLTIPVAVMVGLIATVLHFARRAR